ncbi:MAG: PQQ-binding-like beta-propeller repeat protein [Planctomycetota bacterium]
MSDVEIPERKPIRVWPALVIAVLTWAVVLIPGWVVPLTFIHFVSMQLGPVVGALAMSIWWLNQRQFPRRTRWISWLVAIVSMVVLMGMSHSSLRVLLTVYGLPTALTTLAVALFLTRGVAWPSRRLIAWFGFIGVFLAALFVRVGKIDAAFAFTLVPRWTPTAEDNFLASLDSDDGSPSETSGYSLPQTPAADDWPEFRGPLRNGIVEGVSFSVDWNAQPPAELWRRTVGPAWSSFCVVGPLLFTQEQRGEDEAVVAYDVETGQPVWTCLNEGRFEAAMGGIGPRATPTYDEGALYVMGSNGLVQRIDAITGESSWKYDLVEQLEAPLPAWGFASSPLVVDEFVIVFAGGGEDKGVVALNRSDGTLAWSSGVGSHGYASAQLATIGDQDQVLMVSNVGVESLEAGSGESLWLHEWDIGQMARTTQPLIVSRDDGGASVYLGTGYGNGTMRVDVRRDDSQWVTEEQWIANLKPYFNDMVHAQGHLFGFDGAIFMAADAETGEKAWKRGRYGHGQVLLVADMETMLVITEDGDLLLVDVNVDRLNEIARIKAVEGVTWNHPVIAGGRLFIRNADTMVAYDLPLLDDRSDIVPAEAPGDAEVLDIEGA